MNPARGLPIRYPATTAASRACLTQPTSGPYETGRITCNDSGELIRSQHGEILLLRCQRAVRILTCDRSAGSDSFTERLEVSMRWEKPTYKDLRFGFEVTMYIYNR